MPLLTVTILVLVDSFQTSSKWMLTASSTGTLGDRIAASVLLIQQNPIKNISLLESLIKIANKKGGRRENSCEILGERTLL